MVGQEADKGELTLPFPAHLVSFLLLFFNRFKFSVHVSAIQERYPSHSFLERLSQSYAGACLYLLVTQSPAMLTANTN